MLSHYLKQSFPTAWSDLGADLNPVLDIVGQTDIKILRRALSLYPYFLTCFQKLYIKIPFSSFQGEVREQIISTLFLSFAGQTYIKTHITTFYR